MATDEIPESVPAVDTLPYSSNTRETECLHGNFGVPAKHQLLLILEGYGLEGFVLGTVPSPSPFVINSEGRQLENLAFLVHKKQDKFLASWLLSTVTDEHIRPANSRLGLNGRVSNDIIALECDVDTKSVSNNKFIKKALHGLGSRSEKHEKRTRNKDRPDHRVWAFLHCSDVPKASEERLTPFVLQSALASCNPNE
ncbi:hypothetical protein Gohar_002512, partial [Gossypium harknessii]|nr:hypothetical protein [Gossypium harknessii]